MYGIPGFGGIALYIMCGAAGGAAGRAGNAAFEVDGVGLGTGALDSAGVAAPDEPESGGSPAAARRFSSLICWMDLVCVVMEENSESMDEFAALSMEFALTLRHGASRAVDQTCIRV